MPKGESALGRKKRHSTLRDQIEDEGARAAYEALIAVCRDPKAPAQARATAGTTLFRSAGLMDKREPDETDKEAHEMSHAELMASVRLLIEEQKELELALDADHPGDLFD